MVAGLAYNYLPFTALPLYVAIERIDRRVLDAAHDLYANTTSAFMRVILPLAIPGIFAAFLLTFIPAFGDYVNQEILGGTSNTMIGTVIQNSFLVDSDYAGGSALAVGGARHLAARDLALRPATGLAHDRGVPVSVGAGAAKSTGPRATLPARAPPRPVRAADLLVAGHRLPGLSRSW